MITNFNATILSKDSLNAVESFQNFHGGCCLATAVWRDTILFNVEYCKIRAYDVSRNKWYLVHVEDPRCYKIVGEAVVVADTIYALADWCFSSVLHYLLLKKATPDGDLVFECSLLSYNSVPAMQPKLSKYDEICDTSRHLVHLGKDDFCVVQCCLFRITAYQRIQVFYITKLSDYSMIMTGDLHHDVEIQHYWSFDVILGFSLLKGVTAELKEGKSFDLDPHPEFYAVSKPVQEEEIVNPVQEEEIVTTKMAFMPLPSWTMIHH